jgi:hypothetical protein
LPNKLIISTETAKNSEIGEIFKNHDEMFVTYQDRDMMILILFLIYERIKGEESFWHPYFEVV